MKSLLKLYREKIHDRQLQTVVLIWLVLSSLLVSMPFIINKVYLKQGAIATSNIVAPRDIKFETEINKIETKKLRAARANAVTDVYEIDINMIYDSRSKISRLFSQIRELKSADISENRKEQIKEELSYEISLGALRKLQRQPISVLTLMENLSFNIVKTLMTAGVSDKNSEEIKAKINQALPSSTYKVILKSIIKQSLENNVTFNEEKTKLARLEGAKEVQPIYTQFRKGQPILYQGDLVTTASISVMKQLGIYRSSVDWPNLIALIMINLFLILFMLLVSSAHKFENIYLVITLEVIVLLLGRFVASFSILWIPIIFVAMMLALFMTPLTISMAALFRMSILTTLMIKEDMVFMLFFLFTALVTNYLSMRIQNRNNITKYAFLSGVSSILIFLTLQLHSAELSFSSTPIAIGYILLNCWVSAILVHGFSPYFEYIFKLLTPIKLLELADPAHPLLSRLMLEAPGTYHHSLMVANLAEKAVDALDGKGLIARVGSYYHDIGKLSRPYFFIENQTGVNPHDKIGSQLSAKIIISHTQEGEKIARKYKLPGRIIDIIKQHHGTSIISYFYREQLKNEKEAEVNVEDFHYPGPLPESLEASVVMLADSCEAAIKSLEKPTPNKVESMISKIIKDKLDTGQLDKSNLTFAQLSIVKEAFMKNFEGMFHSRIKYEEDEDNNG